MVDPAPRFFCDDHLRRLARWLRAAGFDVAWEASVDDARLPERLRAENRRLLTMDRKLARRVGPDACLIPSHDPTEQLRWVRERFRLDLLSRAFTRCTACNVPLAADRGENAPERVRRTCTEFRCCPECGRTYWMGDHVLHMIERFRRASEARPG
jgi:uncharacterized protein with PIN domain